MKFKRGHKWIICKILFYFMVFVAVIFTLAKTTFAESLPSHLVINEIYSNPNGNENEFIELYNPFDINIVLDNYSVEDGTATPKFLNGLQIDSKNYLVLQKGTDFTFTLNNDSDRAVLKQKQNDGTTIIIDSVAYGNFDDGNILNNAKNPSKGKSITRNEQNFDSNNDLSDFIISVPSPNKAYEKFIYSNSLIISELCPHPDNGSENEFIELNNSGNETVDLSFWRLDDEEGGSSPYEIPNGTTIDPGKYLTFYKTITNISLNDDGDSARLIDPNEEIKNQVEYSKSEKGLSYSIKDNQWFWSMVLTPGAENEIILPINNPEPNGVIPIETDILSVRNLANGILVKVSGIVTVLPGVLSAQYFYIQDQNSGIQIYCYKKDFPALKRCDNIVVIGELSESNGEKRIKINIQSDILIIENSTPPPPTEVKAEITEEYEGVYVKIQGQIVETSGSTFIVDNGVKKIKVIIRKTTGIKKPKMRKGDMVEIAGIVSEYKGEYRILPFLQDDVKIISSAYLPKAGANQLVSLYVAFGVMIIWNIYQKVRKKQEKLPQKSP